MDIDTQYNYMQLFRHISRSKEDPEKELDNSDEQGFAKEEVESLIIPKQEIHAHIIHSKPHKPRNKFHQPKLKLTFLGAEKNSREQLRKIILRKQEHGLHGHSVELTKKQSKKSVKHDYLSECVSKIKRTAVGQNISIPTFWLSDSKAVKQYLINSGVSMLYELPKQLNTHGYLRRIIDQSFLGSKYNQLLHNKIRQSFVMPKKGLRATYADKLQKCWQFSAEHECANMQFATVIGQKQYQVYIKNDTNTHGHQVWFSFRVHNPNLNKITAKINICNIKRDLRLFQQGAKVYSKGISSKEDGWRAEGNDVQFKVNTNAKFTSSRVFKLIFQLTLEEGEEREVSLLPSYSYSDMLHDIQKIRNYPQVTVEILTYSLLGLAIPIVTIGHRGQNHKNMILVNCRVHSAETNASYMCRGLLKAMVSNSPATKEFLQKNIIKIIPMLNPDGVVYGNFRTNFLGADLNRSFDTDDEVTNPQVVALKQLGYKLKQDYADRFTLFIDLHGHSSQKNIFAYGPDYETTESNFYQIRLLPKILALRSRFFRYGSCCFRLEDYKQHTARGFFINVIKVNSYTIESSYSLFSEEGKNLLMGPKEWQKFGQDLAESLGLLGKITRLSMIKNKSEMKRALGETDKEQLDVINKFKKQFRKEKEQKIDISKQSSKNPNGEDSDGENQSQDYTRAEKEQVARRVMQTSAPNLILPRVLKPSIVYPTVTPKLFRIRDEFQSTHLKILYNRRGTSKYGSLRQGPLQILREVEMLQPDAKSLLP